MKNVLMIGYKGEVGSAIYSILKESKKYKMFKKDYGGRGDGIGELSTE